MLSFASDYTEGACEEILQKLAETNRESLPGYGMDRYCQSAARKIQEATGCPEAEVYFLVGGTQTNAAVISSMLAPYEGVVAAQTGHVSIHEAGAIEYTGHKVLQLPEKDGKIDPADLQEYLQNFEADANHDHMVFPGMVYLSHPTEYGTLYSRKELQAISEICRSYEIPLYLDGARLGYGLAGEENDRMEQIEKEVSVSFWERYDEDHTVVRFATSWATREADLEHLWEILDRIEAEREK